MRENRADRKAQKKVSRAEALLTKRTSMKRNFCVFERDGCGFAPTYPPKTWTAWPAAPEIA
jgi:hypothetical protein